MTLRAVIEDDAGGEAGPGSRPAVVGAVCFVGDITEMARRRRELEARATLDELTGSRNRAAIRRALVAALAESGPGHGVALVFVDLDGFKQVNDTHGHRAGDRLLAVVAERLRHAVRAVDVVGRLGGDEFLVVCPGVEGPGDGREVVERVAAALAEPADVGVTLTPGASIGVAWTADPTVDPDELIARADASMYDAKRAARPAHS